MESITTEMVMKISYFVLTIFCGSGTFILFAYLSLTVQKEANTPLNLKKVLIRAEIRTLFIILRAFIGFNIPVFLIFVLCLFTDIDLITYCFGVAFSSFISLLMVYSYWRKRYPNIHLTTSLIKSF